MRTLHFNPLSCVATAMLVMVSSHAGATLVSGTFTNDDDLHADKLTLAQPAHLRVTTLSWALGGFAPVLALFDGSSLLQLNIGSANNCNDGIGGKDTTHGFCWDAQIDVVLNAGDYTLILSQDSNLPLGQQPADGYKQDGVHDYTNVFNFPVGSKFIDVTGSQRSSAWAFNLDINPLQRITEPAPAALLAAALAALVWTRRQWVEAAS